MKEISFFLAIGTLLFLTSCENKIEVTRLDLENGNSNFFVEYYMISNPPTDINKMIYFINWNKNIILKNHINNIDKSKFYIIEFYEERFFFNRNYKPHYKWYNPYIMDDIRDGVSHMEDKYFSIILKNSSDTCSICPNMPIYMIYSKRLVYYPNGFRNDPGKHWEKMKD